MKFPKMLIFGNFQLFKETIQSWGKISQKISQIMLEIMLDFQGNCAMITNNLGEISTQIP